MKYMKERIFFAIRPIVLAIALMMLAMSIIGAARMAAKGQDSLVFDEKTGEKIGFKKASSDENVYFDAYAEEHGIEQKNDFEQEYPNYLTFNPKAGRIISKIVGWTFMVLIFRLWHLGWRPMLVHYFSIYLTWAIVTGIILLAMWRKRKKTLENLTTLRSRRSLSYQDFNEIIWSGKIGLRHLSYLLLFLILCFLQYLWRSPDIVLPIMLISGVIITLLEVLRQFLLQGADIGEAVGGGFSFVGRRFRGWRLRRKSRPGLIKRMLVKAHYLNEDDLAKLQRKPKGPKKVGRLKLWLRRKMYRSGR